MVSRIHTVKNVSHLMDMSGKELIHEKLIHETMGTSPSRDHAGSQNRRPDGCGIMTVPHSMICGTRCKIHVIIITIIKLAKWIILGVNWSEPELV